MNAEIEDFEGFSHPTYRGTRVNGCLGGYVVSQHGCSGM
jgi:hypothetical protein